MGDTDWQRWHVGLGTHSYNHTLEYVKDPVYAFGSDSKRTLRLAGGYDKTGQKPYAQFSNTDVFPPTEELLDLLKIAQKKP